MNCRRYSLFIAAALLSTSALAGTEVFDMPVRHTAQVQAQNALMQSFRQKRFTDGEKACRAFLEQYPDSPEMQYNLACALALQGRVDGALSALDDAVRIGFREPAKIRSDTDLAALRADVRFAGILKKAEVPMPTPTDPPPAVEPAIPVDGAATVTARCTRWNPRIAAFISRLGLPAETPGLDDPVVGAWPGQEKAARLVRTWYAAGTAAGNHGDYYDNHDRDHSNMVFARFPQLSRIEYDEAARGGERGYDSGLQSWFVFNRPVLGNSSTALATGAFWRSQTRYAMTDARRMSILARHYLSNHLYIYPEHRDYDPGNGDCFPANTPYVITCQGSSGSDRPFLHAFAATMAACKPDVKDKLFRSGALVPALQQIFRMTYSRKGTDATDAQHYLNGAAHPVVFDASGIDVEGMVRAANALAVDKLPPVAALTVVEDVARDPSRPPVISPRSEVLFTTPAAVARVYRRMDPTFEIVLNADNSRDAAGRDLAYHWVVLQGSAASVSIRKLDGAGSRVHVTVPWFEPFPVDGKHDLLTHRIDIGLFVHNGVDYSPPAILSVWRSPNEDRKYDMGGRLVSIDYRGERYADPSLVVRKNWKDSFVYAADGSLARLIRDSVQGRQEFDARGSLITQMGDNGEILETRPVRYALERDAEGVVSMRTVVGE